MKILVLAVLVFFGLSVQGQTPPRYTKINMRYDWTSGKFDSAFGIPVYGAVPVGVRTGETIRAGYLAVDTLNHDLYYYTDSTWRTYVSAVFKSGDSIYYALGPNDYFAFVDNSGSGGANIYNADSTLSSDRTVEGDGKDLRFNSINHFGVGGDTINLVTPVLLFGSIPYEPGNYGLRWNSATNKVSYFDTLAIGGKVNISDTSNMLLPYLRTTGDLSGFFTTTETSHNTDFTAVNTSQYKVWGRTASGSGVPSYVSIDTNFISNFSTMVRPLISAGAGITYNSTTGVITSTASGGTVTSIATAGLISGGTITTTGTITTSMATNKLVGRGTAGTGIMEEITLGTLLSLSGTTLNVTEVDGSTTNELQQFINTSNSTSHALSLGLGVDGFGSLTLVEGTGITLTTTGTSDAGIVTIAATNSGTVTSVATAGLISGGTITSTGTISTSMATNKLVGRGTAGTGIMEEITLGTNLALSGTTLNATDQYVGTVTSVTANDGNGFNFTVTNGTTAAVIDLTTTVTDGRVFYSDGQALAGAAGFTFDKVSAVTLGAAGSSLGTLNLTGNTSGTISIKGQAAAGTYNFNLPTTAGTSGYALLSAGGGASPMTWGQVLTTADNGVTAASGNVKWGGTLTANTTINTGGYTTTFTGSNAGNTLSVTNTNAGSGTVVIAGNAAGTNAAVGGVSTNGTAGSFSATGSGAGVVGTSVDNYGGYFRSTNQPGLYAEQNPSSTNTVVSVIQMWRNTSGTAADGIGGSLDFVTETSSSYATSNQLISKWTTANNAALVSALEIKGINAGSSNTLATFAGSGLVTLGVAGTNKGSLALTGNTSGTVTIQPAAAAGTWSLTLPTNDGDANQVLKTDGSGVTSWAAVPRYTPLVVTTASVTTSVTIDADVTDMYVITAQAGDFTFNAPTGTIAHGQKLIIRMVGNGGNRGVTWNAAFRGSTTLPLPPTCFAADDLYCGFVYNSTDSKWDFVAQTKMD